MDEFVIETHGLRKSFKGQAALAGLNLRVPAGSIFGFLGRNGAGKTTTIKTLMGLLRPDSGDARVFGLTPGDSSSGILIRRRVGYVAEDKELYPYMTVAQIIQFTRGFFPRWRDDLKQRYVKLFELPLNRKIPDLSKGNRSKLMLLLAICRGADLLILDEPSDGLDPVAVRDVLRELVALAGSEGITIFFSSHQLDEVEQIADRVCIIDHGTAVVTGSLDDMKTQYQRLRVVFGAQLPTNIRWEDGADYVHQEGRMIEIFASRNVEGIVQQAQSLPGASVERFPVTLKEIFLETVRSN
ncbi:MAG TPA: ABC transporter ATP-binding protein [Terriglobales bacterium]|nr:ABC transporter ATP-binding protein [Terriglobales bacterium]